MGSPSAHIPTASSIGSTGPSALMSLRLEESRILEGGLSFLVFPGVLYGNGASYDSVKSLANNCRDERCLVYPGFPLERCEVSLAGQSPES